MTGQDAKAGVPDRIVYSRPSRNEYDSTVILESS